LKGVFTEDDSTQKKPCKTEDGEKRWLSPLGRTVFRSPRSLFCPVSLGVVVRSSYCKEKSRSAYKCHVVVISPVRLRCKRMLSAVRRFATDCDSFANCDLSSVLIEDTVFEQAGFVRRRSESFVMCVTRQAGFIRRRCRLRCDVRYPASRLC